MISRGEQQTKHETEQQHEQPPERGGASQGEDAKHEQEVEDRSATNVRVIHDTVQKEGQQEIDRPVSALAWSGLAAGMSMSLSMIAAGCLAAFLPEDAKWAHAVSQLGYSVGFLVVVLGRQQLYTENTLTVMLPLLERRTGKAALGVLRVWSVVLVANLIGAAVMAFIAAKTNAFEPEMRAAFTKLGQEAMKPEFMDVLMRGILAGWIIALMVWVLPGADAFERSFVIVVLTYIVGVAKLSHIIAGSVDTMYLAFTGDISWAAYATGFLVPSLIGNTIGGVTLTAAINHAQVATGED